MARVVELVVFLNALGGLTTFALTRWKRRRSTNRERIAELEQENREIDAALERLAGKR